MKYKHSNPLISIIIPSFNQGNYLEETILSVIQQDFSDFELIIIDGGSTDNSVSIIEKYSEHIAYWVSEADNGQAHAINKGLAVAKGEWVNYLNSDDCFLKDAFKYLFTEIKYDKYDFLYGNGYNGRSIEVAKENKHPSGFKKKLKHILRFFYNEKYIIPSQSVVIRKSVIDAIGCLDESLHYCMDLDWYCRVYLYTEKRLFYNKTICFFRLNEITKTGNSSSNVKMKYEAIMIAERYLKYLSFFDKIVLKELIRYYKSLLKLAPRSKFLDIIKVGIRFPYFGFWDITYKSILKQYLLNLNS